MTASIEPGSDAAFGSLLRRLRLAAGLTHETLADAAGLSVRGLSDLERGLSHRPQKETLRRLAAALSLAPEDRNRFEAAARGRGAAAQAAAIGESALPISATPLIGRAVDVSAVKELFNDRTVRLVTLTGPGGVGKTRLALQVVEELQTLYPAGVTVVNLAPLRSSDAVAEATARALGLREAPGTSWQDQLHALLRAEPRLLLLDNFEHVLPAAMVVSELLAHCPRLRVLVTSRARLRLSAEHEVVVAPLAVPSLLFLPSTEELAATPSIALFVQRARAIDGGFSLTSANAAVVAELCVRLDGLPLAIELAAVRTKLLTPAAMLTRLHQRLQLLTGGARDLPARQQTLRQTLDWSYDLLDERSQRWFRRLAVFVGGWSLDAVSAVCGVSSTTDEVEVFDVMAALQDASLIQRVADSDAEPRFTMLETVLAYAKDRLEAAGEADGTSRRHADYFVGIAEQAVPTWSNAQRAVWYGRLADQVENIRAALQWSVMEADPELGLRLAAGLHWFWETYSHGTEGRYWCEEALKRNPSLRRSALGVRALCAAGALAWQQGDHGVARAELEECIAIADNVGEPNAQGVALHRLGVLEMEQGHTEAAQQRLTECIALLRGLGDRGTLPLALFCLRDTLAASEPAAARKLFDESLDLARSAGDDFALAGALNAVAHLEAEEGNLARARTLHHEVLVIRREHADRWGLAITLVSMAELLRRQGELQRARDAAEEGLEIFRLLASRDQLPWAWQTLSVIALDSDDLTGAAAAFRECLPRRREQGNLVKLALTIGAVASLAHKIGRAPDAARLCGAVSSVLISGNRVDNSERRDFEATVAQISVLLPAAAFDEAWKQGEAMTLSEAETLAQAIVAANHLNRQIF